MLHSGQLSPALSSGTHSPGMRLPGVCMRVGEQMPSTIWFMSLHAMVTDPSYNNLSCRTMGRRK